MSQWLDSEFWEKLYNLIVDKPLTENPISKLNTLEALIAILKKTTLTSLDIDPLFLIVLRLS